MHMSYVYAIPMKEKSAENVVQPYLSGIFTHKGGSTAILGDNEKEFKNTVLDDAYKQHVIKGLFLNPISPPRQLEN